MNFSSSIEKLNIKGFVTHKRSTADLPLVKRRGGLVVVIGMKLTGEVSLDNEHTFCYPEKATGNWRESHESINETH